MKTQEQIINDSIKLETPPVDYNSLEIHCFLALKQLLILYHNKQISKENASKTKQIILADYEKRAKQYEFESGMFQEYIEHIKETENLRVKLHKMLNDNKEKTEQELYEIIAVCIEIIRKDIQRRIYMSNKKIGNDFEKEFAEILSKDGYWVTLLTPKQHVGSQPCDLIAIKDNTPILVDCKTCKTHIFQLRRIEANQWQAHKKYQECGNCNFVLAIKYNEKIFVIDLDVIDKNKKSIDLDTLTYNWEVTNENNSIKQHKNTRTR